MGGGPRAVGWRLTLTARCPLSTAGGGGGLGHTRARARAGNCQQRGPATTPPPSGWVSPAARVVLQRRGGARRGQRRGSSGGVRQHEQRRPPPKQSGRGGDGSETPAPFPCRFRRRARILPPPFTHAAGLNQKREAKRNAPPPAGAPCARAGRRAHTARLPPPYQCPRMCRASTTLTKTMWCLGGGGGAGREGECSAAPTTAQRWGPSSG